jgi:hypothetical protein
VSLDAGAAVGADVVSVFVSTPVDSAVVVNPVGAGMPTFSAAVLTASCIPDTAVDIASALSKPTTMVRVFSAAAASSSCNHRRPSSLHSFKSPFPKASTVSLQRSFACSSVVSAPTFIVDVAVCVGVGVVSSDDPEKMAVK